MKTEMKTTFDLTTIYFAVMAASAAPAIVAACFMGSIFVVIFAFFITMAHVVILGLPAYLLLEKKKLLSFRTLSVTGFILGMLPVGMITMPPIVEASTIVQTIASFKGSAAGGALGAIGAFAAWFVIHLREIKDV